MKGLLVAALALSLLACEDPLKRAQLLEEPRVLGVRVATPDDHASLLPGQSATLSLLLAGPAGSAFGRLSYQVCEAAASVRGVPYCAATPFAQASVDLAGAPIAFDVPSRLTADARLVVLGAVCPAGEPQLSDEPSSWSCSDGAAPLGFSFDAHVAGETFVNQNPDLLALQIRVGGTLLALDALDAAPDCDAAATSVAPGSSHEVALELGQGARDAAEETLQLSHFATAGEYSRTFSFVEPGGELSAAIEWLAPATDAAAKHYLVVRDGRGGVSWRSFSLCVR